MAGPDDLPPFSFCAASISCLFLSASSIAFFFSSASASLFSASAFFSAAWSWTSPSWHPWLDQMIYHPFLSVQRASLAFSFLRLPLPFSFRVPLPPSSQPPPSFLVLPPPLLSHPSTGRCTPSAGCSAHPSSPCPQWW